MESTSKSKAVDWRRPPKLTIYCHETLLGDCNADYGGRYLHECIDEYNHPEMHSCHCGYTWHEMKLEPDD